MNEPTIYKFTSRYGDEMDAFCVRGKYTYDNSLYAELYTNYDGYWEPWASITVNLGGGDDKYAFIDTNNFPEACKFLEQNGLAKPTGLEGRSGFCTYPLYEFTDKFFNESETFDEE